MSVNDSLGQAAISINPPVAQKRPVRARGFHLIQVQRHDERFFLVGAGFGENLTRRSSDETLTPEFDAIAANAIKNFMADAVRNANVATVRNRVAALNRFPGAVLERAVFFLLAGMPADGCWIKKNFRALQCREPRAFGIPLVPANQYADLRILRLPGSKTKVARREIKFLVVKRIVRNVHLAIDAEQRAVRVNDGGRVVINTCRAFLE